ncbi:MAG: hypothetical protein IJS14_10990 [Lentisphaeria bacterium]|nr:hypothetical protein [Lentisphaeria bacterium]
MLAKLRIIIIILIWFFVLPLPLRIKFLAIPVAGFFALLIYYLSKTDRVGDDSKTDEEETKPRRPVKNPPGKKYSWAWMQAAGGLELQFLRPEDNNGWPGIRGQEKRIGVAVQCLPPKDNSPVATLFTFQFQEPAKIGLLLMLARSKEEITAFARGRESLPFREQMPGRVIPDSFFLCSDLACFRKYFNDELRDHLTRLSLIYPSVLLTGTKLSVRTDGVSADPMGFQMQIRTLLAVAQSFNQFAWNCAHADEEIAPEPGTVPAEKTATAAKAAPAVKAVSPAPVPVEKKATPPAPEKTVVKTVGPETPVPEKTALPAEPAPAPTPAPATAPAEEKAEPSGAMDQEAFIRTFWAKGLNSLQQKELFAPYAGKEIEWSGVLKSSYAFSTDFVFGSGGGIKATFDLGEFKPEGSFLSFRIKAVAALPKDAADRLKQAAGKTFRFRGTLLKIEPIAKEIYLTGGHIIGAGS